MALHIVQIGAEAAPIHPGDLGESTTALARALAECGAPIGLLALLPHDAEPPAGFARRLARIPLDADELEVFEGSLARQVPSWLLRIPPGRDAADILLRAVPTAVDELDIPLTVAHAHGRAAVAALEGIGRVRPSAVRVATVAEPAGVDAVADAVVMPALEADEGAWAIAPGIDDVHWNPQTDGTLAARFSADAPEGKRACRSALQRRLGLAPRADVPLFAFTSEALRERFAEVLAGDRPVAAQMASPIDGLSARELLAAADFFVAEAQDDAGVLRALRYGAVPLVKQGGRASARIVEFDEPSRTGQGLTFDADTLAHRAFVAGRIHAESATMALLRLRALRADVSWRGPARRYLELFDHLSRE